MKLITTLVMTTALTTTFIAAPIWAAVDDGGKGLKISTDRKERDLGWGDSQANMTMILKNSQGDTSERKMRLKSFEVTDDGDKGLTIFDEPKDVSGTAFLSFSHIEKADDQWLYLPALKRVKRISSRNKSGPFMGSEFAYEDMGSFEPEKYEFTFLRDESCAETMTCHVIESKPLDEFSGYTKIITWLDTEHLRPMKTEYYDRKESLLKTLKMSEWHEYKDKYWRAALMDMENHQSGKSTRIITHEIVFDTGLTDADFNQSSLQRAR
ncbi:MAG: outer membrane lipoprotein-sorting protein [Oleibacter sp.]|nr:outer membrane lipoprotein-sorting protein [Thalassolituus sp.]